MIKSRLNLVFIYDFRNPGELPGLPRDNFQMRGNLDVGQIRKQALSREPRVRSASVIQTLKEDGSTTTNFFLGKNPAFGYPG